MKKVILFFWVVLVMASCAEKVPDLDKEEVTSPDGKIALTFEVKNGVPYYQISKEGEPIISPSRLGFIFQNAAALDTGFHIVNIKKEIVDNTWELPWGESKTVRDYHQRMNVALEEKSGENRKLNLEFRVFNDGVGFRYEIPEQPHLEELVIMDELTEFALAKDFQAWWIPAVGDNQDYEYLYKKSPANVLREAVHTPLTMEYKDSLYISIHEAALVDYAGMTLLNIGDNTLSCDLVPWSDGTKVKTAAPMKTPWRTILIGDKAGDLVTSNLILNLNEPNQLEDDSWIKPARYTGIWWGMHLEKQTWGQGPKHGATTENVKAMMDFAAKNNLSGVLAEGWNEGWDGDWTEGRFDFTKPYPDFDLAEITRYGEEVGVGLIGHHETGGNVESYDRQLEDAFDLYKAHNVHYVKTGYVSKLINDKERHQGQYMVRHFRRVMEEAAKRQIMLDTHEPVKQTGLRRTFPNLMTAEGARGTEYDAWSDGNPPSHTTILPFTRLLAGPMDYTPGIFDIMIESRPNNRVQTTLAKQLALYIVIYSPLQMTADLPENYKDQPAFEFIKNVPVDWEETKVLNAKIGEYITTVRRDKESRSWYLGSITNEKGRTLEVPLDFLDPNTTYQMTVYADGKDADMTSNPLSMQIDSDTISSNGTTLTLQLAPGGGAAVSFQPMEQI
ncbi:glycoside hydrolase family 97 protein [Limibacter armeniacum]|uniref:glycoside hydrolase family 97 protein n=1 Tax=Limibacter armeniacum TaxID=466084 RepID=UPI002FE539EE